MWTFWTFSLLAFVLLFPFHPKFVAQAEVSSLRTNDRFYRRDVTPLEARVTRQLTEVKFSLKVDNTKVSNAFQKETIGALKPKNVKKQGNETQNGLGKEEPIGIRTVSNYHKRFKIPGKKYGNTSEDTQRRPASNVTLENTFPVARKEVKRSVGTIYSENVDRSGEAQSRERFVETVQAVSNSRAEFRRTGEDARGSNPRQSEPHLDTSTFALSGDSAHNLAMVHWSGHNSSVSFSLTQTPSFVSQRFQITRKCPTL